MGNRIEPDRQTTEVQAERHGATVVLTLHGPGTRNAIGPSVYDALRVAVERAGEDPATGSVVIFGAGGFFSSGGNVQALRDSAALSPEIVRTNTDRLNAMIRAIVACPCPVIAAVEGGAAGAGLALGLACDMIVAAREAKFTAAYVRVGLSPDGGVTYFLRGALPRQMVMEICLLGRPVLAERLHQAGLVNQLAEPGAVLDAALALADMLADGPPQAQAAIKAEVDAAPRNDLATHLEMEAQALNAARFGAEAAEGLSAFLAKRRPDFRALRASPQAEAGRSRP